MAELVAILPIISALTGTTLLGLITLSPEGGLVNCVKDKVNGRSYDYQVWNKMNTSGQLSVQWTSLTQWISQMSRSGSSAKNRLNSIRLELNLPIKREFRDNNGNMKVLEPYPLAPHYMHAPRVSHVWRFDLHHMPSLKDHQQQHCKSMTKDKADLLYSVWIESLGYKATDDITAYKITWPKDNPFLYNYFNTMIWLLSKYDFNTGLVMENIRGCMQADPSPLTEQQVLELFARVKNDDYMVREANKLKRQNSLTTPVLTPANYFDKKKKSTSKNTDKEEEAGNYFSESAKSGTFSASPRASPSIARMFTGKQPTNDYLPRKPNQSPEDRESAKSRSGSFWKSKSRSVTYNNDNNNKQDKTEEVAWTCNPAVENTHSPMDNKEYEPSSRSFTAVSRYSHKAPFSDDDEDAYEDTRRAKSAKGITFAEKEHKKKKEEKKRARS